MTETELHARLVSLALRLHLPIIPDEPSEDTLLDVVEALTTRVEAIEAKPFMHSDMAVRNQE